MQKIKLKKMQEMRLSKQGWMQKRLNKLVSKKLRVNKKFKQNNKELRMNRLLLHQNCNDNKMHKLLKFEPIIFKIMQSKV